MEARISDWLMRLYVDTRRVRKRKRDRKERVVRKEMQRMRVKKGARERGKQRMNAITDTYFEEVPPDQFFLLFPLVKMSS